MSKKKARFNLNTPEVALNRPNAITGTKLTTKQRLFVASYIRDFNATRAAIDAGYSEKSANAIGLENLGKPRIKEAVDQAIAERMEQMNISSAMVLTAWHNAVMVDRNEFIQVRRVPCGFCEELRDGETNRKMIDPHCEHCEGEGVAKTFVQDTTNLSPEALSIYEGVREGKYGIEVLLPDRQKAYENLARHLGMYTDKVDHTTNGKDICTGLGHFYGGTDGED